MSTETASPKAQHLRAVTITTITALAGVAAAFGSLYVGGPGAEAAGDGMAQLVVVVAIIAQIPLYDLLGYDDFGGAKDYLFVAFMTFAFWFVTWGIMLTTGFSL
ncbi:hypothetical protein [Natranaeroarchaeum aerophilus]|uniref:Uncharacterized protein n=1 Tax=Natranaeroarchaeum aerophilus TaxID=2917711 RepID=A0AAE3FTQ4_9EURY|nr:hypothetical protein [Natranaeroarchaeum aerophilus]MCL9814850.1 hypothetical protein [Natranaeroarchaeum aerophilus]